MVARPSHKWWRAALFARRIGPDRRSREESRGQQRDQHPAGCGDARAVPPHEVPALVRAGGARRQRDPELPVEPGRAPRRDPDLQARDRDRDRPADGGSIIVRDNAAGIAHERLGASLPGGGAAGRRQRAVPVRRRHEGGVLLVRQGVVAAHHDLGEEVVRRVEFDVPQIVASRDESLDVVEEPTDWRTHFTEITMTQPLPDASHARRSGKIKTYLGGIYRQFLRNGDVEILFNGEPVEYEEPTILVAPRYNDRGRRAAPLAQGRGHPPGLGPPGHGLRRRSGRRVDASRPAWPSSTATRWSPGRARRCTSRSDIFGRSTASSPSESSVSCTWTTST